MHEVYLARCRLIIGVYKHLSAAQCRSSWHLNTCTNHQDLHYLRFFASAHTASTSTEQDRTSTVHGGRKEPTSSRDRGRSISSCGTSSCHCASFGCIRLRYRARSAHAKLAEEALDASRLFPGGDVRCTAFCGQRKGCASSIPSCTSTSLRTHPVISTLSLADRETLNYWV